ncbi:hypothetical protein D3C80_711370 [compost metagenome]
MLQRLLAGIVDLGGVLLELLEVAAGAEQEHAAVPEVVAGLDELRGALRIGLLDEPGDAADPIRQIGVGFGANVAVAGFRPARRHAEQHHLTVLGSDAGEGHRLLEGLLVFQHMIGGEHQQQFVAAVVDQLQGGDAHRRCGIAAEGFEQDRLGGEAQFGELILDDEAVVLVADQQRRLHAFERQALERLLEQRVLAGEDEELLGELPARKRPEPRAATARENDGNHGVSPVGILKSLRTRALTRWPADA